MTEYEFVIHQNKEKISIVHQRKNISLLIDLQQSVATSLSSQEILPNSKIVNAHFIIGTILIQGKNLLVYADQIRTIQTNSFKYHQITSINFLPYLMEADISSLKKNINDIKEYIQGYFYFSFSDSVIGQYSSSCNLNFQWNFNLFKQTLFSNNDLFTQWYTPMIQGYIDSYQLLLGNQTLEYVIISRRSQIMGGTRFNCRGIDEESNVANHVETEQIVKLQDKITSCTFVRGSVPTFWNQDPTTGSVSITKTPLSMKEQFFKHIYSLMKPYGQLYITNLLGEKSDEKNLTSHFEKMKELTNMDGVYLKNIDFQALCSGHNFNGIDVEIMALIERTKLFGFSSNDGKKQQGIFRVNCLDCLDRTNYFMFKLSILSLQIQLSYLGLDHVALLGFNPVSNVNKLDDKYILLKQISYFWANNADVISIIYTGTESTISIFGKESSKVIGALAHINVSVSRFFKGTITDSEKQKIYELLSHQAPQPQIQISEFSIKLQISTWNVNALSINKNSELVNSFIDPSVDMYVFGFQEVVELNPMNVVLNEYDHKEKWNTWIRQKIPGYSQVISDSLVGIQNTVFIKDCYANLIKNMNTKILKTGLKGAMGNKGAVQISFRFANTSFSFITVHLEAGSGQNELQQRIDQFVLIHKEMDTNVDYSFFYGDTNFRVCLPYEESIQIVKDTNPENIPRKFLEYDQLKCSQAQNETMKKYQEAVINFMPTYKLNKINRSYEGKKKRTPSYTDRILLKTMKQDIEQLCYISKNLDKSDHFPVFAQFKLQIK